jgi:oligopeptide/dipeptide ABC transporter ATP-binding protein
MKPRLEVTELGVEVGGQELLTDVNLFVGPGRVVGLVGETGSGKSLTCRAVLGTLGLIGGSVVRGSVKIDGVEVSTFSHRQWQQLRGRSVALVPQSSMSGLDPLMRVDRQLYETIRSLEKDAPVRERAFETIRRLEKDAPVRERAMELLESVALDRPERVLRLYPHELSGGMRQRVMIALAIAGRPDLLIADEPTTALDVTVQKGILELLCGLARDRGMGVLIVTHDLALVEQYADDVSILYAGVSVESGSSADVLNRPRHPYTRLLLAARPQHVPAGGRLPNLTGSPPSPEGWTDGCRFEERCPRHIAMCAISRPAVTKTSALHNFSCFSPEEESV